MSAPLENNSISQHVFSTPEINVIIFGSSTGGPSALQAILPYLPAHFPIPVIVVQHMSNGFTKPMAERLNALCQLKVKEAEHKEVLAPGTVYVAPAGSQTLLYYDEDQIVRFKIDDTIKKTSTSYEPSVNVTLHSAVKLFGSQMMAVILTGMGRDGLDGCVEMKKHHAYIITEHRSTSIVYGMPKVVYDANLSDANLPLDKIAAHILKMILNL